MACHSKTVMRQNRPNFWVQGYRNTHMEYLDFVVFKDILGSFNALVSKWPVTEKCLVIERNWKWELGILLTHVRDTFDHVMLPIVTPTQYGAIMVHRPILYIFFFSHAFLLIISSISLYIYNVGLIYKFSVGRHHPRSPSGHSGQWVQRGRAIQGSGLAVQSPGRAGQYREDPDLWWEQIPVPGTCDQSRNDSGGSGLLVGQQNLYAYVYANIVEICYHIILTWVAGFNCLNCWWFWFKPFLH